MPADRCPCGTALLYSECCEPLHQGRDIAVTAEALMRSRYSAYVLKLSDYLAATWHSSTCPPSLDVSGDTTVWLRLRVLSTEQGGKDDDEGVVEFAADYQGGQLHEQSRFLKEAGRWFYLDGEMLPPQLPEKVGRNDPCPCGSGKKFKKCCA